MITFNVSILLSYIHFCKLAFEISSIIFFTVWSVTNLPDLLSILSFDFITNISFSVGFINGQYGSMVITVMFLSFQNCWTSCALWIGALSIMIACFGPIWLKICWAKYLNFIEFLDSVVDITPIIETFVKAIIKLTSKLSAE